jgi:hypothetical protein
MSSVVRLVSRKKTSIQDLVKNLVGNLENVPTETDIALAEEMEELAEEHGGEYDPDNNSVIFDGKDSSVTVFASTDDKDKIFYQAVHEQFKPHIFTSGRVATSFKEALAFLDLAN